MAIVALSAVDLLFTFDELTAVDRVQQSAGGRIDDQSSLSSVHHGIATSSLPAARDDTHYDCRSIGVSFMLRA